MPFTCSICGEESTQICVRCTKDSCDNHLCERCRRCSDCCECEVKLSAPARMMVHSGAASVEAAAAEPEAPEPEPAPEPAHEAPAPDDPGAIVP
jgi:hypothetical protein